MFRPLRLVPAILALAVMAAGCSKNTDTAPAPFLDQAFADQIAQHVGMMLAAGTGGSMLSLTATAATLPAGAPMAQDAARPARDTSFTAGTVTWTLVDTFFTAGNTPQEDYDALATHASIHAAATGTIVTATFNGVVNHHADLQMTNLASLRDTINLAGTARDTSRSVFTGKFSMATVRLSCVSAITHEHFVVMKGQSPFAAPGGGLSDWIVQATRFDNANPNNISQQATVEVLVAFDGTTNAILQVGGLYEYTVDLTTGALNHSTGAQLVGLP